MPARNLLKILLSVGGLLGLFASPVIATPSMEADPAAHYLRVNILHHYHPHRIEIRELAPEATTYAVNGSMTGRLFRFAKGFRLVLPEAGISRSYAGDLEVRVQNGELQLINRVRIEDYVISVVLSEMGWQKAEAMRAQAVLARTWAYRHRRQSHPFDFGDRTDGQVYKGLFPQSKRTAELLYGTNGQMLWYRGHPARVYYHAKCAARTYSSREIWGGNELPYLSGRELPKRFGREPESWQCALPLAGMHRLFSEEVAAPVSYEQEWRHGTMGVRVTGADADEAWLPIDLFRLRINRQWGWNKLKSNSFSFVTDRQRIYFEGHGFGHLVGMCQQGAVAMAGQGHSYQDILQFFYPGTIVYHSNSPDR